MKFSIETIKKYPTSVKRGIVFLYLGWAWFFVSVYILRTSEIIQLRQIIAAIGVCIVVPLKIPWARAICILANTMVTLEMLLPSIQFFQIGEIGIAGAYVIDILFFSLTTFYLLKKDSADFYKRRNKAKNWYSIGDGNPLLVESAPEIKKIFSNPAEHMPLEQNETNCAYWKGLNERTQKAALSVGYLQHPNPDIRKQTIREVKQIEHRMVAESLMMLLNDHSADVQKLAAETICDREKDINCAKIIELITQETRKKDGLLEKREAINALDFLYQVTTSKKAKLQMRKTRDFIEQLGEGDIL